MKKIIGLVLAAAMVLVITGCSLGINGSSVPAGTYELTTTYGTWTLVLEDGTFDYKQETASGTQLTGFKGTFDSLLLIEGEDSIYDATLTTLTKWSAGTTYDEITLINHTIKLNFYDLDPKEVSFYLDETGDGEYSSTRETVILGMILQ